MDWRLLRRLALLALACASIACEREAPEPASSAAPAKEPARSEAPAGSSTQKGASPVAHYVGRTACEGCHADESKAWHGSDHDRAMEELSEETVLGDFDGAVFEQFGVSTRFFKDGSRYRINTEGADGKPADFDVKYTFGVYPLQQYLVDVGGGRLQAFPIAWDVEKKKWFSLYPDERIPPGDPLHWTAWALNWNQGCAYCHSTDLQKRYDAKADTYATTWAEIDVSCEACHGPASAHVAWAKAAAANPSDAKSDGNLGLLVNLDVSPGGRAALVGRDRTAQRAQVETCGRCHARRSVLQGDDRLDRPLMDSYVPELLRETMYHPDGQVLDEVYEYGSFLQSRMYHEGVACSDCHDPHSLKLKAEGNALCGQCHEASKYDVPAHTHHPVGSPGAQCVSCHMREWTFMEIDARRDHGFHLPRPDLTVEVGVPNACNGCHEDKSPEWARDKVIEWFGPERPFDWHATSVMAAGRQRKPAAEKELAALVADRERPAILRATALTYLRGYTGKSAEEAALQALRDPDPLVRGVAIGNVAESATDPAVLTAQLSPLLEDESRYVRMEAGQNLSRIGAEQYADRDSAESTRFWKALDEYRGGQMASLDQPSAHLNLGVVHQNLGEMEKARAEYLIARRLDPTFVPGRFNLAMLDALGSRKEEAEAEFRQVIRLAPQLAEAQYSLGLLLAEDPARITESAEALTAAARLAPANARIQYNAGLAAQHLGRHGDAEPYLRAALDLEPENPQFLHAMAILYMQQGRLDEALPHARRLVEVLPNEPRAQELVQTIERAKSEGVSRP